MPQASAIHPVAPSPLPNLEGERGQPSFPSPAEISEQLERILGSRFFAKSEQLRRMLRYLVERRLASPHAVLKEMVLGQDIFARGPDFDPRIDPIVRVEARRLRSRLESYYREEGRQDSVAIRLDRGSYTPRFQWYEPTIEKKMPTRASETGRRGDDPCAAVCREAGEELAKATLEHGLNALKLLQQAAMVYPERAEPRAGLAHLFLLAGTHLMDGRTDRFQMARDSARHALTLDENSALAHAVLGVAKVVLDYDFDGANGSFLRAQRIEPDSRIIRNLRAGFWLMPMGLLASAVDDLGQDKPARSEPGAAGSEFLIAQSLYLQHRHGECIARLESILQGKPRFLLGQSLLAMAAGCSGQHQLLKRLFCEESLIPYPLLRLWIKGTLALAEDRQGEAQNIVEQMEVQARPEITEPVLIANLQGHLGEYDKGFAWLERGFQSRSLRLLYLRTDPLFDRFRGSKEFSQLLERVNLARAKGRD